MNTDFFKVKITGREPREMRGRILFSPDFVEWVYFAVANVARLRQKIEATRF